MALGNVIMTDTDGNIGTTVSVSTEKVCGLLFDTSAQTTLWTKGPGVQLATKLKDKVIELNSMADVTTLGLAEYTGKKDSESISLDFMAGIPYYHINQFFTIAGGTGRLFIMFADCSTNWDAIVDMQKAANGMISQFGVWTEQSLWKQTDVSSAAYSIQLIGNLQSTAENLATNYNAPANIFLCANTAKLATATTAQNAVLLSKIPTCIVNARYVSVFLGQDVNEKVTAMQTSLASCTPVGVVGMALGICTKMKVSESIGWVDKCDLAGYLTDIEMGFGDSTIEDGKLKSSTKYSSLTSTQLESLDTLGYNMLVRYQGYEGHIYFSGDQTCDDGDYRTIMRNRTMNKVRRSVRLAFLPYVNAPIKVNPSNGQLSAAQITVFTNLITDVLTNMTNAEEISGAGTITIPATQNILKNDALSVSYQVIPIGIAKTYNISEGFALKKS